MFRRSTILAALLGTMAAVPAHAQTSVKDFFYYCQSTAIRACASTRVETTWDAAAGLTRVNLMVRSLQGWLADDNTGGGPITRLGLIDPVLRWVKNFTVSTIGAVKQVNDPARHWMVTNWPIGEPGPVTFDASSIRAPEGGIFGCNLLNKGQPSSYFQTCGNDSWVVFSFTTRTHWDASQAEIAWKVYPVNADGNPHICRTANAINSYYECRPAQVSVTPEPVSMALLGSGLFGLAGFRHRRRRREVASA